MPKISSSAKAGDFNTFDNTVRDAGHAVCSLTESAAQVNIKLYTVLNEYHRHPSPEGVVKGFIFN